MELTLLTEYLLPRWTTLYGLDLKVHKELPWSLSCERLDCLAAKAAEGVASFAGGWLKSNVKTYSWYQHDTTKCVNWWHLLVA